MVILGACIIGCKSHTILAVCVSQPIYDLNNEATCGMEFLESTKQGMIDTTIVLEITILISFTF